MIDPTLNQSRRKESAITFSLGIREGEDAFAVIVSTKVWECIR